MNIELFKARVARIKHILSFSGRWPWVLLVLVLIVYNLADHKTHERVNTIEAQKGIIAALADTVYTVVHEDSSKTATIRILEAENASLLDYAHSKDTTIIALTAVIEDYKSKLKEAGSSATVMTTETAVKGAFKSKVTGNDSFPEYSANINMGGWITGTTRATKDSIYQDLKIRDEYDIVLGSERRKGEGRVGFADVTTHNPYNTVKTLRSYRITEEEYKPFAISGFLGYGTPLIPPFRMTGVGGIGLTYTPKWLRFK